MKRNLQAKRYRLIKYGSILLGAFTIPLDVWIGFLLGGERWSLAFPLIGVTILIAIVDSIAWAWVLEQMAKDKVEYGKVRSKTR